MKLINADMDKMISIREVMEALEEATFDPVNGGYFSYDCDECGHEDDYFIEDAAGTGIEIDVFEDSLVRRLDRGE